MLLAGSTAVGAGFILADADGDRSESDGPTGETPTPKVTYGGQSTVERTSDRSTTPTAVINATGTAIATSTSVETPTSTTEVDPTPTETGGSTRTEPPTETAPSTASGEPAYSNGGEVGGGDSGGSSDEATPTSNPWPIDSSDPPHDWGETGYGENGYGGYK